MRNPRRIVIELETHPQWPLFAPGAKVEFHRRDQCLSCDDRAARGRWTVELPWRTSRVFSPPVSAGTPPMRSACRHVDELPCARSGSILERRLAAGDLHVRGRVVRSRPGRKHSGACTTCHLTAFVFPPRIVHRLVRRLTASRLNQARRDYLDRLPDPSFRRNLHLYLLLCLKVGRTGAGRDHPSPEFAAAWEEFARSERRRMCRRLRNALRRLNPAPGRHA